MNAALDYLRRIDPHVTLMEVCGTHTAAIARSGLKALLPSGLRLVSGPGCPVCVTPSGYIDSVIAYAAEQDACVLSFGDLFRVPGGQMSFADAKAAGGDFRVLYAPFEAVALARANPDRRFLLAAVGFETTIPLYALIMETLVNENIRNLKLALSLKTMPAAMAYICENGHADGFICPGHVSVIIGANAYAGLLPYRKPMAIAGFTPPEILAAIARLTQRLIANDPAVDNLYPAAVTPAGNTAAQALVARFFQPCAAAWRGIGIIPASGLAPRGEYAHLAIPTDEAGTAFPTGCRCADVLLGKLEPVHCPLFNKTCTPENPVGACMVSAEGACGIWART